MDLPFHCDESFLKSHLEKAAGRNVLLTLTENSTSMISVRASGGSALVRLHRIFLSADRDVLDEITEFIKKGKGSTPHIRRFIRDNVKYIAKKPRRVKVRTGGRFHDLRVIYDSLNDAYFNGEVSAPVTWGSKSARRSVRRRILGSYCKDEKVIRINPVLDSGKVPRYYMEYVVYHEMLHAHMDAGTCEGRVHSNEFKRRERMFRHFQKALSWEKDWSGR